MSVDPRVLAIRRDRMVGHDTCSVVDECYTDAELVALLDERGVTDRDAAVNEARKIHVTFHSVADDIASA